MTNKKQINNTETAANDSVCLKYTKGELKMVADQNYDGPERRKDLIKLDEVLKVILKKSSDEYASVSCEVKDLAKSIALVAEQSKETNKTIEKMVWKLFDKDVGMFTKLHELDKDVNGNGKPGMKQDIEDLNTKMLLLEKSQKSDDEIQSIKTKGMWKTITVAATIIVFFCGALWATTTYIIEHANSFVNTSTVSK